MKTLLALLVISVSLPAQIYVGIGHTTAFHIDADGDGCGVGTSGLGQTDPNALSCADADDGDATVQTAAQAIAKWGNLKAFWTHLGYNPAGVVFVQTTGNDSTCTRQTLTTSTTRSSACATVAGAISKMSSGDMVSIGGGSYVTTAALTPVGGISATYPSIFLAYPGELPILNYATAASGTDGWDANSVQYWVIDGLAMAAVGNNGMGIREQQYGAPNGIIVRNCEFIGWYDQLFIQGGSTNLLIEKSYFHDLLSWGEHNMYLGANPAVSPGLIIQKNIIAMAGNAGGHQIHLNGRFTGAYIGGNIMYGSENETLGLQMGVSGATIENNAVWTSKNGVFFIYDYADSSDDNNVAFDQNNNTFRNNTFYYDGGSWENSSNNCSNQLARISDLSGSSCVLHGGTCTGTPNACVTNGGTCTAGVCSGGGYSGGGSCTNESLTCTGGTGGTCSYSNTSNRSVDLGHNTFDNNLFITNCPSGANANAQILTDTDINGNGGLSWLGTDTFRNNIIVNLGPATTFLAVNTYTNAINYTYSGETAYTFANFESDIGTGSGTNLQSNPLLVAANPSWYNAPGNWNLRVSSGSPAIGAGLHSDAPATDIAGTTRANPPSIGAYEYLTGASISPSSLPAGTVGTAYSQTLTASGFSGTVTWSLASGSLPTSLSGCTSGTGTTCTISGTPSTTSGSPFSFTIQATDGTNTATDPLSITINAAPSGGASVGGAAALGGAVAVH